MDAGELDEGLGSTELSTASAGAGAAGGLAATRTSRRRTAGKTEAAWPVFTKQVR